ncbi:MAG: SulP family inorganic anion transporter, partial [Bacteroidales bacterium]|nr:SulP family inorganic anion transporter [Bacteroidales bacterium]
AYNMSEWRTFKYLLKGNKTDVSVLLITFFLTVIIDLTVAIEVGLVLAIILFVKRISETSTIKILDTDHVAGTENDEIAMLADTEHLDVAPAVEIYEIDGPFFFGLASKLEEIDHLREGEIKVRIIRMRKVPFMDSTGLNNLRSLWKRSQKDGVQLILSGVNDNVLAYLTKVGFVKELGKEFIFPHIIPAVAKANELSGK